ncbi:MAG: LCP family protein [Candidatus Woesebacteria bacterium]|nr:MAG: LCP family protein [Candidatus Woesebacteria bacterium]
MISRIKSNWQNILIGILLVGIFALGFFISYLTLKLSKVFTSTPFPQKTSISPTVSPNPVVFAPPPEIAPEKGVYNAVLLGYGGAGHAGSLLTDSIIVIHVNTNKKTAAIISIPRDLWVSGNHKINAEASINGFQNEGGVIKDVTGLSTDYFVSIDFDGFVKLIDDLGGITVTVPKTFDDPLYPITGLENDTCGKTPDEINALKAKYSDYQLEIQFTCRYEHIHFDLGPANLDGATALKFVRSRHGDSDFGRSERQFAVLKGILAKLISLNALSKTNQTIDTLSKLVRTNLNISAIRNLIDATGPTSDYIITDIHLNLENVLNEGKSAQGAYILYPKAGMLDFSQIRSYIANQL